MAINAVKTIRNFIKGATVAVLPLMAAPSLAFAENLTAASMMKQMNDKEQYNYIAGVIAGLGTARNVRDGNDTGAACIDKWFYETPNVRKTIYAAFEKFGDRSPSAILYALAVRECGK